MRLYEKLKSCDMVEDYKDYTELVWLRAIKVNGKPIDNPCHELSEEDKNITIGILDIE